MVDPRTTREALFAEMMGDLDTLFTRIDNLPNLISDAERRLADSAAILIQAGEKYQLAVNLFTDQARNELTEHLLQKTKESIAQIQSSQHTAQGEPTPTTVPLKNERKHERNARFELMNSRMLEHGVTATLSSTITAILVLLVIKLA